MTWPPVMSLTPSKDPAASIQVLQEWIKRHSCSVFPINPLNAPNVDPKPNDESFRNLLRLLMEKNLVCTKSMSFGFRLHSSYLVCSCALARSRQPCREPHSYLRHQSTSRRRILPRTWRRPRATQRSYCLQSPTRSAIYVASTRQPSAVHANRSAPKSDRPHLEAAPRSTSATPPTASRPTAQLARASICLTPEQDCDAMWYYNAVK